MKKINIKKFITAIVSIVMIFSTLTACGQDVRNDNESSKAAVVTSNDSDNSTLEVEISVSRENGDTTSVNDSSEDDSKATSTTKTSDSSKVDDSSKTESTTKNTDDSSSVGTTSSSKVTTNTTAKTTTQSVKTTTRATTTTTKPTTTTKKTTTTTKATQPATQKSALDLAYEAMVKCNTPTQAQLNLITNDLNNYVKSKGFCVKSVLDTSFYPFEKNGKPTFDINGSTGFGNCGFFEGFANDRAASAYYEGAKTLEQAREFYKKELRDHIDYMMSWINATYKERKKDGSESTQIKYSVMIYRDCTNPMQRFDLKLKYSNFRNYTMTIGYEV